MMYSAEHRIRQQGWQQQQQQQQQHNAEERCQSNQSPAGHCTLRTAQARTSSAVSADSILACVAVKLSSRAVASMFAFNSWPRSRSCKLNCPIMTTKMDTIPNLVVCRTLCLPRTEKQLFFLFLVVVVVAQRERFFGFRRTGEAA